MFFSSNCCHTWWAFSFLFFESPTKIPFKENEELHWGLWGHQIWTLNQGLDVAVTGMAPGSQGARVLAPSLADCKFSLWRCHSHLWLRVHQSVWCYLVQASVGICLPSPSQCWQCGVIRNGITKIWVKNSLEGNCWGHMNEVILKNHTEMDQLHDQLFSSLPVNTKPMPGSGYWGNYS